MDLDFLTVYLFSNMIFLLHLLGIILLSDKVFNCYITLLTSYVVLMPLLLEEQK